MNKHIEELKKDKIRLLVKNCKLTVKEIEDMTANWKTTKRITGIAASFTKVSELGEHHIKHFKSAPYMFKPLSGNIFGGMLLDDKLDYVHLVLLNEEVLEYILDL